MIIEFFRRCPRGVDNFTSLSKCSRLFLKASKAPFLTLRVATLSGAPRQAPLEAIGDWRSFPSTIGDKKMTCLTLTPDEFFRSLRVFNVFERESLGALLLNCLVKITLPTLRAKGTLISEPRFSTPARCDFSHARKGNGLHLAGRRKSGLTN